MGVKVTFGYCNGERVFPHARDWFVTDERVLQIYQEHEGDPEFVVMEYNRDAWEGVEWDPPIPAPPQPDADEGLRPGKWYREHTPRQLQAEYRRRGLPIPTDWADDVEALAEGLNNDDKKNGTQDAEGNRAEA